MRNAQRLLTPVIARNHWKKCSVRRGRQRDMAAISLHRSLATALFATPEEASMKKIVLALAVAVATAAAASAQTAAKAPAMKAAQTKSAPATKAPAMKPMTTKAEVVSTDAAAKTITVKDSSGSNMTLTATGGAVAALASVKAGDWVTVTHTDTNATKIVKAKPASAKAKK
jgi:glucose/arabinose dehydrogenase